MTASDYMHQIVGDLIPSKENFTIVECANLVSQDIVAWNVNSVSNNKKSIDSVIHKNNVKQVQVIAATYKKINNKYILNDNNPILKPQVQVKFCALYKIKEPFDFKVPVSVLRVSGQLQLVYTKIESLEIHKNNIKLNLKSNPQGVIFLIKTAIQSNGDWQMRVTKKKTNIVKNFTNSTEPTFICKGLKQDLISEVGNVVTL